MSCCFNDELPSSSILIILKCVTRQKQPKHGICLFLTGTSGKCVEQPLQRQGHIEYLSLEFQTTDFTPFYSQRPAAGSAGVPFEVAEAGSIDWT